MNERAWKWTALFSAGVTIALITVLLTGWQIYGRLFGQGVVKTATSTLLRLERDSQLVTTRAYVQAVVRQRSEEWYGNAEVIRIVPATVSYAVSLAEIDRTQLKYDATKRVLSVPLPEVRVIAIDPDLAHAEIIRSLDLLRSQSGAGNALEEATEKMVRPELEKIGRSPEALRIAREQAIVSVRSLLESALAATGSPVEVRPYFASDGLPAM
jgi:hypothetical protein